MKESETSHSYAVSINNKRYTFSCLDGEEHVQELKDKLIKTINSVSSQESGQVLSDYAMKIAFLLADETVNEKNIRESQQNEIEQVVKQLVEELDSVLDSK